MSRTRLRSSRLFRILSVFVCIALFTCSFVLTPLTSGKNRRKRLGAQDQNGSGQGQERRVPPLTTVTGAPAANLPSLDALRADAARNGGRRVEPPRPIPSTRRSRRKLPSGQVIPGGPRVAVTSEQWHGHQEPSTSVATVGTARTHTTSLRRTSQPRSEPGSQGTFRSHHARSNTASSISAVAPTPPQNYEANFALAANGGVASSSSNYTDGTYNFVAGGANNGVRSGASWGQGEGWNDASANNFPDWLQIDFSGSKTIDEIDLFFVQDNWQSPSEPTEAMTFTAHGMSGFEVQYWTGTSWSTVPNGTVSGNNKIWRRIVFSPIATTRIRVVTNSSVDGWSHITEIEAWGPAPPSTNVALAANGGVASSSSNYTDGTYSFVAAGANNGVRSGAGWGRGEGWNDASVNSFPDWLQIDFSGSKIIGEVDLFFVQDNWQSPSEPTEAMTFTAHGMSGFDVQYWTGSVWTTVPGGNVSGNNKIWKKITFSPLTTNKIRVLTNGSADGWSHLTEIEAWDTLATGSGGSSSDFAMARLDPRNRTGAGGEDLLSNNFNWSLPLVGLPGRGLDLGLTLSYNSLVWTRSANYINFDLDRGSIAPGFRLGFPTIEGPYFNTEANANFYLLVTPSGRRIELRQTTTGSTVYESKDSSYLQLTDNLNATMTLRPTDGSQMNFISVAGGWRCNQIKDRNGNYITAAYKSFGEIETVTDTLNRTLTFNYDSNDNLQSITQQWAGQPQHQWATFGWGDPLSIGHNFSGLNNQGPDNTSIAVLRQVGLPDGSSYEFYYNSYGQITTVNRSASDTLHHSYTIYEYGSASDDCPRITSARTWATNWSDQQGVPHEVVSYFGHDIDGGARLTMPDGTVYKEYYGGSADFQSAPAWQNGLLLETKSFATIADADSNSWKKLTTTQWTQDGSASYLNNPRVTQTDIADSDNNHRRTTIDYGSTNAGYVQWGLPYVVKEWSVVGSTTTELRRTQTDYNLSSTYLTQRIIGLVSETKLYDPLTSQWLTKQTYGYDTGTIDSQATTATNHDAAFSSALTTRGNVTSVSRWDVTDIDNSNKRLTSTMNYNAAGSLLSSTDPANHTTSIAYSDSFSDGNNARGTFAYPTTVTDADGFSSTVQYRYEHGAKTRVQTPLPNVTTNQPGPITTFEYDDALRISRVTSLTNGAYTRYEYGADYLQSFSTVNNLADEAFSFQLLNGRGQIFISGGIHPGSVGGYKAQTTYYDVMGRVMKQSNPTEIDGSWTPAGDDAGPWAMTTQTYDWKGRPWQTIHPDNTYTEATYSGCGCAGGDVVTLTDEMSRQQKVYSDVLGRQWKAEVMSWPDGNGNRTVYTSTVNTLDARDQVTMVRQWAGAENGSGAHQDTTMSYDGYGRLALKHVPEQQDANGNPTYTTWAYNPDDTTASVTDARGVSATYGYNNRRLVTAINYSAPNGIAATSAISYLYDSTGNRINMVDGSGSQAYGYDQVSRLTSETRTITGAGSFTLAYEYNFAGELKRITDASNTAINYGYDAIGRVNGITGSDNLVGGVAAYASSFAYRAWGGLKTMTDGSSHTSSLLYNSRLQPTQFDLSGSLAHQTFDYYNDGRISYVHNATDINFDRAYSYDHLGRLTENKTGGMARGDATQIPFHETFGYDPFSNLTERSSQDWNLVHNFGDSAVYGSNRRLGWGYDNDGRNTSIGLRSNTFDAAGQQIAMSAHSFGIGSSHTVTQAMSYQGDGMMIKEVQSETNLPTNTAYYLRSTVLGGAIIEELNGSGQKTVGYVYLPGGRLLAAQNGNSVFWKQMTPAGTAEFEISSNSLAGINRTELDPLGAAVPVTAPEVPPPTENQGDVEAGYSGRIMDARWSDFFNLSSGCTIDGVAASCSMAMSMLGSGAGVMGPANTTRWNGSNFEFFHAYADGYSGWLPSNANYQGNGVATRFSHYDYTSVTIDGRTSGGWHPVFTTINLSPSRSSLPFQQTTPQGEDLKRQFYRLYQRKLAHCVWSVFSTDLDGQRMNTATIMERQTLANSPDVDISQTTAQLGGQGKTNDRTDTQLGNYGTIHIASDLRGWTTKDGQTISVEENYLRTYAHELGNLLSARYTGDGNTHGTRNGILGAVSGNIRDYDTGARLETCIFGNSAH